MFLIVGLGNPGKRYVNSRHNIGFIAVDYLIDHFNFAHLKYLKFNSELISGTVCERKLIFAKPHTYMNLSGNAVQAICVYYKIALNNLMVIHDDIDLTLGTVKFKYGGGNGGHNGLKSIDHNLGNNYYRLRVGIGRPENANYDIADYVLARLTLEEYQQIIAAIKIVAVNFGLILLNRFAEFKEKVAVDLKNNK